MVVDRFCSAKRSSVQTCVGDMVSSTVSCVLESSATQKGFEKANLVSGTFLPFFFFFFLSLALSTPPAPLCSSLKPPGRRRKKTLAASEIG